MSLKGTEYETVEEANMRLSSTVVLYEGEPVYITEVRQLNEDDAKNEIYRVYSTPLPYRRDARAERKLISSGKFDLSPFRMGFMNFGGHAYYLSRNTARQNRQGLSERSLTIVGPPDQPPIRLSNIISEQEFVDMIKGKYPSMEEAVKMLQQPEYNAVAVSREYALKKDTDLDGLIILYHKDAKVGFMAGTKSFKLSKKFHFLKEQLKERNILAE